MSRPQSTSNLAYLFPRDARAVVIKETRLQYLERTASEHGYLDECLLWPYARQGSHYGHLWIPELQQVISVHRISFFLAHGHWPYPQALHKCDVVLCYAWFHLVEGNRVDNMADMIAKGRRVQPKVTGEMNGRAKLTDDAVREIRTRYQRGRGGLYHRGNALALAKEYGVNRSIISGIVLRKLWKHIK